jgi:hypothetical protein
VRHDELLADMVQRLKRELGAELVSVVLYGPAAHGEDELADGHLHLLIVLADLEPETLARLGAPMQWWLGRDQPWPRLFTRELIADSLDVFPIEFLDIARHHRVIHGSESLAELSIDRELLRLQCERELREKLMRLREAYVIGRGRRRALERLLVESYASFAPVLRACLHLLGAPIPVHDREVAAGLCQLLDLPAAPLVGVSSLAGGGRPEDLEELFAAYYRVMSAMTARIDRMVEPEPDPE